MIEHLNKGYETASRTTASDEQATPRYAVEPLIEFITPLPDYIKIWCPFDTEESQFVKVLSKIKKYVFYSHIDYGQDFFNYEPNEYDIIISNPPYSIKDKVFKRLYELNKPYIMLIPIPSLQGIKRFPYIKDSNGLILFDKRINFFKNRDMNEIQKGISFGVCYLTKGVSTIDGINFRSLNTDRLI